LLESWSGRSLPLKGMIDPAAAAAAVRRCALRAWLLQLLPACCCLCLLCCCCYELSSAGSYDHTALQVGLNNAPRGGAFRWALA
jgi:hypothetical protein